MRALLDKDPAKRLGSGAKGSVAVQAHPFFRGINWDLLYSRKARGATDDRTCQTCKGSGRVVWSCRRSNLGRACEGAIDKCSCRIAAVSGRDVGCRVRMLQLLLAAVILSDNSDEPGSIWVKSPVPYGLSRNPCNDLQSALLPQPLYLEPFQVKGMPSF